MRAYIAVTGVIFGLITLAHLARVAMEGSSLAAEPWFILLTLAAAGMCAWAFTLLRRAPRA